MPIVSGISATGIEDDAARDSQFGVTSALVNRHYAWVQGVEVIPLDFPFRPTAAAVEPVVWQDEHGAVVIFETDVATPEDRAILRFEGVLQSKFGYPNDEALSGHPYWQHGLGFYGLFEIKGSTWIEELAAQNRVAFPDGTWPRRPYRHFVLTLHESTFEALCMNVGGRATDDTVAELVGRLAASERA